MPKPDPIFPDELHELAGHAIEARRLWRSQPHDRDHELRHRAGEAYAKAEGALTSAVVAWVAEEAGK